MTGRSVSGGDIHPCLALCNTLTSEEDRLAEPDHLARWYVAIGVVSRLPVIDERELAAARALRDGLRAALLAGDRPAVARLADLWLEDAPGCLGVNLHSLEPRFIPEESSPHCLMVPAVLDALALAREAPGRVRLCAAPGCGALFLDVSRNRSRRWCSMDRCGARAKASAYYRRRRAEERA